MGLEGTKYFLWLYSLIKKKEYVTFRKMTKQLHSIPYIWSVPNDDNRAGDGVALRERYCELHDIEVTPDIFDEPASVFEILIALAQRMEAQLYQPSLGNRSSIWFWEFIESLALNLYSDNRWNRQSEKEIVEIVEIFLNRKYDRFGIGGIFPLQKRTKQDQRKVELWYQMMAYFEENYPT